MVYLMFVRFLQCVKFLMLAKILLRIKLQKMALGGILINPLESKKRIHGQRL